MKKMLANGLAAAALTLPATAMAQGLPESTYGAAGLAMQTPDYADDSGFALNLRGGAQLKDLAPNMNLDLKQGSLWVEGELTQTVVSPTYDTATGSIFGGFTPIEAEVSYTTLGGYMRYVFPVDPVTLEGRVGLSYMASDDDGNAAGSGLGLDFGVGVGFDLIDKIKGVVEYTVVQGEIDHLGFTAQYAF